MATIEHEAADSNDPVETETQLTPTASQGQAIAQVDMSTAVSPFDLPAEQFKGALARRKENRSSLIDWVRSALVEGSDFGSIHVVGKKSCSKGQYCKNPDHFSKPILFLPGAQKITGMLGLRPDFPTLHDYEQAPLRGVELKQIVLRCDLVNSSGEVVATGVGARSLAQDYNDLNKSLKMAQKSSLINATLICAGLSEIFTQDPDSIPEIELPADDVRPDIQQPQRKSESDPNAPLPESRQKALLAMLDTSGIEHNAMFAQFEVGGITEIKISQAKDIANWIKATVVARDGEPVASTEG